MLFALTAVVAPLLLGNAAPLCAAAQAKGAQAKGAQAEGARTEGVNRGPWAERDGEGQFGRSGQLALLGSDPAESAAAPSQRGGAVASRPDGAETVRLAAEDRVALSAHYWAPRARGERAPGAVLVHGAGGSQADLQALALDLNKKGFAVVTVDLRGHGASANERLNFAAASDEEKKNLWAFALRDVQAAANWLRLRPEVHSTNLNLVAVGAGVGLAVRHAARDENVRSLVLLRPCEEQLGFDLATDLRAIQGLPVFFAAPTEAKSKLAEILGTLAEDEAVHLNYVREADGPMLDARRLPRTIVNWMGDQALPKRGRS